MINKFNYQFVVSKLFYLSMSILIDFGSNAVNSRGIKNTTRVDVFNRLEIDSLEWTGNVYKHRFPHDFDVDAVFKIT